MVQCFRVLDPHRFEGKDAVPYTSIADEECSMNPASMGNTEL
jgi:hypothetical protein